MFNNKPPEKLICVDLLSFIQNRKTKKKQNIVGLSIFRRSLKKKMSNKLDLSLVPLRIVFLDICMYLRAKQLG